MIFHGKPRFKGNWIKDHSLSLVLGVIFLAHAAGYWFSEWPVWKQEQTVHQEQINIVPDFLLHYVAEMNVSLVADAYGVLLIVLLSKWFIERDSAESN